MANQVDLEAIGMAAKPAATPEGQDAAITLVSSLSLVANSSDNNGQNQSAQIYVPIKK